MKNLLFVQVRENSKTEIDERELHVFIKSFDTEHDHIHESFGFNIYIEPYTDLQEMYKNAAKTLFEFLNDKKADKIIFDTQVIYNRDGSIGRTRNTYAEQIRLALEELTN